MTIKEGEYGWVWLQWAPEKTGIRSTWKLVCGPNSPTALGFFLQGTRRNPGWFVSHDRLLIQIVATLPRTMSRDEAQDAAKLILLSLKETES
jgi:hypothetical protein